MTDLHAVLDRAAAFAREAGERIAHVSRAAGTQREGHYNFVTETDVAVQEYLRGELTALLPGSRFYAEEQENAPLTDAYTWVVDPIDGTMNFIAHRQYSCVSVALLHQKTPVLAIIHQPYTGEMFTAIRGEGAFLNGRRLRVSDRPFDKALTNLGTSPYYAALAPATAYCFQQFLSRCGDIRRSGSAALDLCDIACGRADIFFELRLSPWDFAAGALLVTEAGGVFAMPYEERIDFGKPACILACNPGCREGAVEILNEAKGLIDM